MSPAAPEIAIEAAVLAAAAAVTFTPVTPAPVVAGPPDAGHTAPDDDPVVVATAVSGAWEGSLLLAVGDEFLERLQYATKVNGAAEALRPLAKALHGALGPDVVFDPGALDEVDPDDWPGTAETVWSAALLDDDEVAAAVAFAVTVAETAPRDAGGDVEDPAVEPGLVGAGASVSAPGTSSLSTSEPFGAGAHPAGRSRPAAPAARAVPRTGHPVARLSAIEVELAGVLGETTVLLHELLGWLPGVIVPLHRPVGDPADLRVGTTTLATGEVVVIDEHYGLRVVDVVQGAAARAAADAADEAQPGDDDSGAGAADGGEREAEPAGEGSERPNGDV